ncbi:MAG: hypothetical protein HFG88_15000 [Dorea sp.]|nr:hypothetical protein [Dorea sp.]
MYREEDLVVIGKRENNTRRNYLVINSLQGKHIPVEPKKAFALFDALAEVIENVYQDERLLLIGFAETATAIGAETAVRLGTKYIQTTREKIPDVDYLFFTEAHSHATEQKLVKDDLDRVIDETDRIIFIEDEVTTGNTILNIVNILNELYGNRVRFSVASILNGMTAEQMEMYAQRGIDIHYLLKTDHRNYGRAAERYHENGAYEPCDTDEAGCIEEVCFPGRMDARRLVDAAEYKKACNSLWERMEASFAPRADEKILVLGTEEFMFPALYIGACMEDKGCAVRCHSTTRSPIAVSADPGYPLRTRYELRSLYDPDRVTYIYDIGSYDRVFVITDAEGNEDAGKNSLIYAIRKRNSNIYLVRWCQE